MTAIESPFGARASRRIRDTHRMPFTRAWSRGWWKQIFWSIRTTRKRWWVVGRILVPRVRRSARPVLGAWDLQLRSPNLTRENAELWFQDQLFVRRH